MKTVYTGYSRIFVIDGATFCFEINHACNEFDAKYRLMIYDFVLGWRTIKYPRNITEAKKMAKEYLIYS